MEYESISLVKSEVFVYNIPPRHSIKVVRAADWNLAEPNWTGRLKVVAKGEKCFIKLEDKITGELFAICPVRSFPGADVEPVSDSSRYFVLKLEDTSGQHAFVGMGFADRGDAFDFNVALQDHFKRLKQNSEIMKAQQNPAPSKDYSLKEGEKIKINFGGMKSSGIARSTKPIGTGGIGLGPSGLLPPPPGSSSVASVPSIPPPGSSSVPSFPPPSQQPSQHTVTTSNDDWGDFFSSRTTDTKSTTSTSNTSSGGASSGVGSNNSWVQF